MKRFSILVVILCATCALAQKADVAFVAGGSFVSDTQQAAPPVPILGGTLIAPLRTDHHYFLEGALAVRMLNARVVSLHVELPIAGIPSQKLAFTTSPSTVLDHVSTVFVTPALRVKIVPGAPISPWLSVGGGWARYSADSGTTTNKAAIQYGGGIDFKTGFPLLGFRAEVRDFVTGDPNLNIISLADRSGLHHHNVLVGGGIVLRF